MPQNPTYGLEKAESVGPDPNHPSSWSENTLLDSLVSMLIGDRDEPPGPVDMLMAVPMLAKPGMFRRGKRGIESVAGQEPSQDLGDRLKQFLRRDIPDLDKPPLTGEGYKGWGPDASNRLSIIRQTGTSLSGRPRDVRKIDRIASGEAATSVLGGRPSPDPQQVYQAATAQREGQAASFARGKRETQRTTANLQRAKQGGGWVPQKRTIGDTNLKGSRKFTDEDLADIRHYANVVMKDKNIDEAITAVIGKFNLTNMKRQAVADMLRGNTWPRPGMNVRRDLVND